MGASSCGAPEHGEHIVAHKLLPEIIDEDVLYPCGFSLLPGRLQLLALQDTVYSALLGLMQGCSSCIGTAELLGSIDCARASQVLMTLLQQSFAPRGLCVLSHLYSGIMQPA